MGVGGGVGEVVNGDNLQVAVMVLLDPPKGKPTDAAETVNPDFGCHQCLLDVRSE
jgi:hypothetical protein